MKRQLLILLGLFFSTITWCADGDIFTSSIKDDKDVEYKLTFKIISETQKTCQIGSGEYIKPKNNKLTKYEGALSIPSIINGYKVIQIADYAFQNCSKITAISIEGNKNIVRIGNSAFYGCDMLQSIEINEGLQEIGIAAFLDCTNLIKILIPTTTKVIKERAFYGCISLSIMVKDGNEVYDSRDNCNAIIETATNKLIFGNNLTLIPNTVKEIGVSAFSGISNMESISLPNSIVAIGESAFSNCYNLKEIVIPEGVTRIEDSTFWYCQNLKSVSIPSIVSYIGENAFSHCNFNELVLPESLKHIGKSAFENCYELSSIIIPSKVESIGEMAFRSNIFSYIDIPESVKNIGKEAFFTYTSVTDLTVIMRCAPISVSSSDNLFSDYNRKNYSTLSVPRKYKAAYEAADYWKDFKKIVEIFDPNALISFVDSKVKNICVANWDTNGDGELSEGEAAAVTELGQVFKGNTQITSFDELNYFTGLTEIGKGAFSYSSLTSVRVPDNVTAINDAAFDGCTGLTNVAIGKSVTTIGISTFRSCRKLNSIDIPNSVTSVGNFAFYGCSGLAAVNIPQSVITIGDRAFSDCNALSSIHIDEGNIIYDSRENCNSVIETATNSLIFGCISSIIPNSITSINNYAFQGFSNLTTLNIPNSVTTIGDYSFLDCSGLSSVTIPNSVISIGTAAFQGCTGLTSVSIPTSVTNIGGGAFRGCTGLTSVTIPESITTIRGSLFFECTSLASVIIPTTVTRIDVGAFYGCSGLTSIIIPNSVTIIGEESFRGCSSITSIIIPKSVTNIGNWAFADCSDLISVTILANLNFFGKSAFSGCNNLVSVTVKSETPFAITENIFTNRANAILYVPKNCGSNYKNAEYWKEFKEIVEVEPIINFADANVKALCVANWDTDGDGELSEEEAAAVTSLDEVFKDNKTITSFDELCYFSQLTSIGSYAFKDCSNLTSVTIPNSVSTIGESSFHRCWALNSVDIPNSVISIGGYAFYNCVGLKSLIIPNSVTSIGASAFSMCDNLATITIPSSVTSIGSYAFGGTKWFNNQPDGLVYAGKVAYQYKGTMAENTNLILDEGTLGIAGDAFSGCTSLSSISLPNGLKVIGASAFYGCTSLTTVIAEMNLPISISEDVFPNRSNIALIVPNGCKTAYEAADYWKDFGCILEQGTVLTENNSIYAEDASVYIGYTADLQINMSNEDTFTAYQFDLVLPNGITLAKDEKGKYIVTLSNRHSENTHQVTIDNIGDKTFRFVCVSLNTSVINGNDGAILTVSLKANNGIAEGELDATIKNVILTTADETKMKPKDSSFTIKTKTLLKGDADGDGEIDVTDVVSIINYIIGNPSAKFNSLAADLNDDGEVDIFDVMMAINLVFSQKNSSRSLTRTTSGSEEQAIVKAADDRIIFGVNDASRFTAFQFDVELTNAAELKDVRLNADSHHDLQFVRIGQDTYRVIGISMDNSTLTTNGNDLVELRLSKECDAQISNIVFVTQDETKVHFAGSYINLTDIGSITLDQSEEIFDLSGRKINAEHSRLPKGVYIIYNKKVVIK